MKIEVVDSLDLINESLLLAKAGANFNRRKFLKSFGVTSVGLSMPFSTMSFADLAPLEDKPINDEFSKFLLKLMFVVIATALIEAKISKFDISENKIKSNRPTSGSIYIFNPTDKQVAGDLKLTLINEWDYSEFSSMRASYVIPPNKIEKLEFVNGPSAVVSETTQTRLIAQTKVNMEVSPIITIRA